MGTGKHSSPQNTRAALKERVADIRRFLSDRLESIKRVRANRAVALTDYSRTLRTAVEDRERERMRIRLLIKAQRRETASIEQQVEYFAAQLEKTEEHLAASRIWLDGLLRELYSAMNSAAKVIDEIEARAEPTRRHWRDKLRIFDDGITRRKRTELSKLQRRLAKKEEGARRRQGGPTRAIDIMMGDLPRGIGTPVQVEDAG